MRIIRNNKSVCPICINKIDAQIVEQENKVYMLKECKEHGKFEVLSLNYPQPYKELTKSYFYSKNKRKQDFYQLILTMRCNLNCLVFFVNANKYKYKELAWIL